MFDITSGHTPVRPPSFRPSPLPSTTSRPSDGIDSTPVTLQPGIYQVRFVGGAAQNFGEGIAVLKDGKINGADPGYVYHGSYGSENDHVEAMINLRRWNVVPNALINLPECDLIIEGQRQTDGMGFLIQTRIQQQPNIRIQIEGRRLGSVV